VTRYLPLLDGRDGSLVGFTAVDAEDALRFGDRPWRRGRMGYAVRWQDGSTVYLHRLILGLARGDRREADHINRDKLDNRSNNLRVATRLENGQNLPSQAGTSRFRGVSRAKKRWVASVKLRGKRHQLGTFATEEEAARVASEFRRQHMPFSIEGEVRDAA
jgi:hypothetical protein